MDPSILLLDCSKELEERLIRQGFEVSVGSVGVQDGKVLLPGPIYEYEIIIYNPSRHIEAPGLGRADAEESFLQSPIEVMLDRVYQQELKALRMRSPYGGQDCFSFEPLEGTIQRGANVLVFINRIFDNLTHLNAAYAWVPNMPTINATHDSKALTLLPFIQPRPLTPKHKIYADAIIEVAPLLSLEELKLPVMHKFVVDSSDNRFAPLFLNKQGDWLAFSKKLSAGRIIALPEFQNNESIISDFLNRVIPHITNRTTRKDVVDAFSSPGETKAKAELEKIERARKVLDQRCEHAKNQLGVANRRKRGTIENDPTAVRVIAYYKQAIQDDERALFYLYKIIDALQNKFGGETAAKTQLGKPNEWKLIGKMANASYGDIRHAPKPADKIRQWDKNEIAECFVAAQNIITAYFSKLF